MRIEDCRECGHEFNGHYDSCSRHSPEAAQVSTSKRVRAALTRHFVTFFSPGTFCAETTTKPIRSWDVGVARRMAKRVVERYGAAPYGFRFTTRARSGKQLDSRVVRKSGIYYLNGKVETLADVEQRGDPDDDIMLSNMRCNGWDRVVTSTGGYRWSQPLYKEDVVLPPTKKRGKRR